MEKPSDNSGFVDSLEKLLQLCEELGQQIDEIGACLYPPQEISSIEAALEKIRNIIDVLRGMQWFLRLMRLGGLQGASDAFLEACNGLRSSLRELASEISSSNTADIEARVENITLTDK
ncbi:cyclin-D1-binding protein 1-like [Trifolium medium]|uniref:Cyclin-D1-binding protein 1-like n=1 Tax=Trifolium medium TaxID=97028 RepID=A0A392QBY6_9FABA|nr:cyclin-D1-binding protein 1-like [Trifolium medium]